MTLSPNANAAQDLPHHLVPDLDGTEGGKQSLQAFVHEAGAVRQGLFCSV